MNLRVAISSLLTLAVLAACADAAKPDPRFKDKDHLTALRLYKLGGPSDSIREVIGRLVILDVVLSQDARQRALATITIPKELRDPKRPDDPGMSVHLVSTTSMENLKKGEQLRIEGIIVDSCYGAYTIYILRFLDGPKRTANPALQ